MEIRIIPLIALSLLAMLPAEVCAQSGNMPEEAVPTKNEYNEALTDSLDYDSELLNEVVVTAKKPLVQTQADKVTYNMDVDPSAQTANVLDAIRKVPMVSVDAEGNIKLKGQSNFKIYVNGKPDPSMSSNYKDILRGMPASSIKKVEVITEPGAKYDAEGVGGIINIVTASSTKLEGYSATLTLSGSNRQAGGNINASGKIGKVSMNLNYGHNNGLSSKFSTLTSIEYLKNDKDHLYTAGQHSRLKNNFDFGNMQMSWEPDTLNLFTLNANLMHYGFPVNTMINYAMSDSEGKPQWAYRSDTQIKQNYLSYTIGANWQHNFRTPDHNIIFLYQYNYDRERRDQSNLYMDYWNYPGAVADNMSLTRYPNHEHTFQLDYTLPFGKKHIMEIGAKHIMRRNYGDTERYNLSSEKEWVFDDANSIDMTQHQDVSSVYAAYTGHFSAFTVKGGLRYEHAHLASKFKTPGHPDYSRDLNDIVPNAMLSYTLPDNSSLRASYQMRITRPGVEQLNPYRDISTPLMVSYGNPDLYSQKSNTVGLTYSNFVLPVQMNVSLDYTYTSDMILDYRFLGEDNVVNTTYGNIGRCAQTSLYAYLAYPIMPGLRVSVSGGTYYSDYKAPLINSSNNGWGWNVNGNLDYEMPWNLDLSLYGGGGNSGASFQGHGTSWSYHGLGLTKSMLNEKRLRITLSASNFFTPTQSFKITTETPDMIMLNTSKMHNWNIGVSISYRLGSFRSSVKQTSKSITNDDQMSNSSSTPMSTSGAQSPTR